MKLLTTNSFEEAIWERAKMKLELEKNNYHKVTRDLAEEDLKTSLFDLTIEYLNAVSGKSELEIHNRVRSKGHVSNIKTALNRFSDCMAKMGYSLKKLDVKQIGDREANAYLQYLKQYSNSESLYKKDFITLKSFFKWIVKVKEYDISNPFEKVQFRVKSKKISQTITEEEFGKLLETVTPENGYWEFKDPTAQQKGKHLYRDYLRTAFQVALETGCRGEELVELKWSHIRVISPGVEIFDITNLKVTRIQGSMGNNREYKRPIPITRSFKTLLISLGYDKKRGKDEYVIPRAENVSSSSMLKNISRAFNHYIKLVDTGGRKIEFKDLRKTYFTRLTLLLGNKAKIFTGHADDKILQDHYLAKHFIAGNLTDFDLFGHRNNA